MPAGLYSCSLRVLGQRRVTSTLACAGDLARRVQRHPRSLRHHRSLPCTTARVHRVGTGCLCLRATACSRLLRHRRGRHRHSRRCRLPVEASGRCMAHHCLPALRTRRMHRLCRHTTPRCTVRMVHRWRMPRRCLRRMQRRQHCTGHTRPMCKICISSSSNSSTACHQEVTLMRRHMRLHARMLRRLARIHDQGRGRLVSRAPGEGALVALLEQVRASPRPLMVGPHVHSDVSSVVFRLLSGWLWRSDRGKDVDKIAQA